MALRDPIAAYNAGSNVEAHLVCGLLQDEGIDAVVVEDHSPVGQGWVGFLAEIHKPQVWIERGDRERAMPVLADYDRRNTERSGAKSGSPAVAVCEMCGMTSEFPTAQIGTVQNCPHCQAYVDVEAETGARE